MMRISFYLIACTLAFGLPCSGQFRGHNLSEYQQGKLPSDKASFGTIYNRLFTTYRYKKFTAKGTFELFQSPKNNSSYIKPSQLSLGYKQRNFDLSIGNFYETIGRGTLLRSFDIPGAVLEDLSFRSRHYFNRDMLGATAKFRFKNVKTKLIYGKPLNYVFPPTISSKTRRPDEVAAIYTEYNKNQQTLGFALMNHKITNLNTLYLMTTANGNINPYISYYAEISKNVDDYELGDFSKEAAYAAYASLNMTVARFGLSLEYKNYNKFLIGSGINEPPALVKEHAYVVLNRSTHVLQPTNEKGYQVEGFYSFPDFSTLTLNVTKAINDFGKEFVFDEYFIEYAFPDSSVKDLRLFFDYAEDPFKNQKNRISTGLYADWKVSKKQTLKSNYEFQTFERFGEKYQNHVLILGYGFLSKFIFNIVAEKSNDSFVVEKGTKIWGGLNLNYMLNKKNKAQLFVGSRRGGPACNAGVCYEVLDFQGVELRLTSRF